MVGVGGSIPLAPTRTKSSACGASAKHLAEAFEPAISYWLEQLDGGGRLNLAALHD
jgi:hypothetical protein